MEKWFEKNLDVVSYRTRLPSYLQSSPSSRMNTNFSTPRNGSQGGQGNLRTISSGPGGSEKKPSTSSYGKPFLANTQSSFFVNSPDASKTLKGNFLKTKDSPQQSAELEEEEKPYMHKRLPSNLDPTTISPFPIGSPQFDKHLGKELTGGFKGRAISMKVEQGVNMNLLKWSMHKRNQLVKSAFKKEMFNESSQFQRLGVTSKSNANLFGSPPRTANN